IEDEEWEDGVEDEAPDPRNGRPSFPDGGGVQAGHNGRDGRNGRNGRETNGRPAGRGTVIDQRATGTPARASIAAPTDAPTLSPGGVVVEEAPPSPAPVAIVPESEAVTI